MTGQEEFSLEWDEGMGPPWDFGDFWPQILAIRACFILKPVLELGLAALNLQQGLT